MKTIDINCDLGEGLNNEALLMPFISSCSIACTAHAGTIKIIDNTIALAIENNVKIGAHPSFPDKANFGRKYIKMSPLELQESIEYQINIVAKRAALQDAKLHHIKAHGALYNASVVDKSIAETLVKAIQNTVEDVFLYVPYNSVIETIALQNGVKIKYEVFIDRNYNDDLTLVSRTQPNALITKQEKAFKHIYKIITEGKVNTTLNRDVGIKADTFCIHGDNENAIYILKYIARQLQNNNIEIA